MKFVIGPRARGLLVYSLLVLLPLTGIEDENGNRFATYTYDTARSRRLDRARRRREPGSNFLGANDFIGFEWG